MPSDNTLQLVIVMDTSQGNAALKTFNINLSNVGKTAGSATAAASSGMDSFTRSITKGVVAGYSLIEVAKLAANALKQMTLGSIDIAAEIGRAAQKTGLTTETLSGLRLAAEDSNVEFASLSTGLARFGKNVFEAATGNKALKETLDSLGIKVRDTTGHLRPMGDLVSQLADRFSRMADGPEKDAAAIKLLGRSGQELIPVLNLGAKGLADFSKEAEEYGLIVNGITAKEAIQFNANLKDLRNLLVAVGIAVGEKLLPSFINLTQSMMDWMRQADGVQVLAGYVASAFRIMANATILAAVEFSEFTSDIVRGLDFVETALSKVSFGKLVSAKTLADNKTALGILQQQRDDLGKLLISFNDPNANVHTGKVSPPKPEGIPEDSSLKEIAKKQGEALRSSREFLISAQEASLATAATIKKDFLDPFSVNRAKFLDEAGKAILEANKETEKLSTFVDDKGVIQRIQLTADTRKNIETALHIKLTSLQNQYYAEEIKLARSGFELKLEQDSKLYSNRLKLETEFLLKQRENSDKLITFQEDQAGFLRDTKLRALEAEDAQTLPQKLVAEKRKADIEVEFIRSTSAVRAKLFDTETDRELAALRLQLELGAKNPEERDRGLAAIQEIANQRAQISVTTAEKTQAEIDAVTQGASNKQVQLAREHYRQIFDSLKQQAGGVFDALVTKSQSVFAAIGNALKTAVLTAIKEIVTSRVAALLLQLFTGAKTTFSPGGGSQITGGGGGILGALGGVFGLGQRQVQAKLDQPNHLGDLVLVSGSVPAVPVVITNSPAQQAEHAVQQATQTNRLSGIAAALGGVIGLGSMRSTAGIPGGAVSSTIDYGQGSQAVGGATFSGVAGSTSPVVTGGGSASGGLTGILSSLKSSLGIGGSIQTGPGQATTWAAATDMQKLGAILSSPAAGAVGASLLLGGIAGGGHSAGSTTSTIAGSTLMGTSYAGMVGASPLWGGVLGAGAGLAVNGLQRGGVAGLAETTAGGALVGMQLGGPIGAAIGAGVGAIAGMVRMFVTTATEQVRSQIQSTYGVDIPRNSGILNQILQIANQNFGGSISTAIRSDSVRSLIQLYAQSTGQKTNFGPGMLPSSFVENGGLLSQLPSYQNGSIVPSVGGGYPLQQIQQYHTGGRPASTTIGGGFGLDNIGQGSPSNAAPISTNVTIPLSIDGSVIATKTVSVIQSNGRVVAKAAQSGSNDSASRREAVATFLQPSTLTS